MPSLMRAEPVLVSVAICNYNHARFLCQAVESALTQTHPRCEVVVVDDGSTDDSLQRLAGYADRIRVIAAPNRGQVVAYNLAFDACCGDVIIFLDADDLLDPDLVARVVQVLQPCVARVQYRLRLIDGQGRALGNSVPRLLEAGDMREALAGRGHLFPSAPGSGNAYTRGALAPLMPLPVADDDKLGADFFAIYGVSLLGQIAALPTDGGSYRVHGSSGQQSDAVVFGNAARQRDEVALARARGERFKRWINERLQINITADLLDFGIEKQGLARLMLMKPNYLQRVRACAALLPRVWRSIALLRGDPLWRRLQLMVWACAVAALPRRWALPLAVWGCNPAARGLVQRRTADG